MAGRSMHISLMPWPMPGELLEGAHRLHHRRHLHNWLWCIVHRNAWEVVPQHVEIPPALKGGKLCCVAQARRCHARLPRGKHIVP